MASAPHSHDAPVEHDHYDTYDAYRMGIAVGSIIAAEQMIIAALGEAMVTGGYDHPLAVVLREARDKIAAARHLEGQLARDAMTGAPRPRPSHTRPTTTPLIPPTREER